MHTFDHVDPKAPRLATAKQIRYALSTLGVRDAWEAAAGVGKASPGMQDWWGWTDPFVENAPKLDRLCKAVSNDAVNLTPALLMDTALAS